MNIETHLEAVQEILETIAECVEKGIEKKQRSIGFHTSLGSIEMLELYLHKIGSLPFTFRLNHAWMKSQKKIREKLSFDFPNKDEIIELMYYIEKNRDVLCYGKRVPRAKIKEQLDYFHELRDIFKRLGLDEIDKVL